MQLEDVRRLKPQILAAAERYGVQNIRVFGSVRRNEAVSGSDLDFLVDFPHPTFLNYLHFKESMEKIFGCDVDVVDASAIRNPLRKQYIFDDAEPL